MAFEIGIDGVKGHPLLPPGSLPRSHRLRTFELQISLGRPQFQEEQACSVSPLP